jgi:hypothetical protein
MDANIGDASGGDQDLPERLARMHHALAERMAQTRACPSCVLEVGTAVVFHGLLEAGWLPALNPVVDTAAVARLAAEHDRLAEDLELLHTIWMDTPDSADLEPLCAALLVRLQEHVARDERMLYGAGSRLNTARALIRRHV